MRKIFTATLFVTVLSACSTINFAQTESRENLLQQIEAKRAELATLEKKFLEPSDDDRANFADFLKQPDTGLIRLLPREVFDKGSKLTTRGGGAYYSFTRLSHEYGNGSDLELQQKHLTVGFAGADYGMMLNVGDIPLDEINIEHPPSEFSQVIARPLTNRRRAWNSGAFRSGTTIDGIVYKDRVPLQVNATYLLRSINYSESDVLVAFRVVRQDTDGSAIIVWKLLKKYPKPELARPNQAN